MGPPIPTRSLHLGLWKVTTAGWSTDMSWDVVDTHMKIYYYDKIWINMIYGIQFGCTVQYMIVYVHIRIYIYIWICMIMHTYMCIYIRILLCMYEICVFYFSRVRFLSSSRAPSFFHSYRPIYLARWRPSGRLLALSETNQATVTSSWFLCIPCWWSMSPSMSFLHVFFFYIFFQLIWCAIYDP